MMSDEEVKRLLQVKAHIEERIRQLEAELEVYRLALDAISARIGEKSFTTADRVLQRAEDYGELVREVSIKGKQTGRLLATVKVYERAIVVVPEVPVPYDSIFRRFFVEKLLEGYVREDERLHDEGEIGSGEKLTYTVERDDGNVVRVVIRNYRTEDREREIVRALRWTLERLTQRS